MRHMDEWLAPLAGGELTPEEKKQVEGHLRSCSRCFKLYERVKSRLGDLREMPGPRASDLLVSQTLRAIYNEVEKEGNRVTLWQRLNAWWLPYSRPAVAVAGCFALVFLGVVLTRQEGQVPIPQKQVALVSPNPILEKEKSELKQAVRAALKKPEKSLADDAGGPAVEKGSGLTASSVNVPLQKEKTLPPVAAAARPVSANKLKAARSADLAEAPSASMSMETQESANDPRMEELSRRIAEAVRFDRSEAERIVNKYADELKVEPAELLIPLREALTGQKTGGDIFVLMETLGKEVCLKRLNKII